MKQVEESHKNVVLKADMDNDTNTFKMSITADTPVTPGLVIQYLCSLMMDLSEKSGIDLLKSLPDLLREAHRIKDQKQDLKEMD